MTSVLEPNLARHLESGSDRNFGFVIGAALAIIGCLPLLRSEPPRWWLLAIAIACVATALAIPSILHPFNRAWSALGRIMNRIVSPLIMGAIFFLCVTPIAWILRWRGKDMLSLTRRPDLSSYWITREGVATSD